MPRTLSARTAEHGRSPVHARRPDVAPDVWADHLRLATDGDPGSLERLVREYERYARSLAGRLHRGHEPREDLDQVALEALVVALKRFDPARGIPFPAFGTPTILGSLRRHFRDHGWLVRVSRPVHELASRLRDSNDRLTADLGRTPTEVELADDLGVDDGELRAALESLHARDTRSLDGAVEEGTLGDLIGVEDRGFARAVDVVSAREAMRSLDDDERWLIHRYYIDEQTQSEIASDLGVSQMHVSRLIRSTIGRLRQMAAAA